MENNIYDYLAAHGKELLKALGFGTMKAYYGTPFVQWFNSTVTFGK